MAAVIALILSLLFGAGDQYLGSISAWLPWSADISLLSAPWLLLPFAAGCTQRDPRRAALLGLACTYAALVGYGVMTLSPLENAHPTLRAIQGFVASESHIFLGGIVTGPLFGRLGREWRVRRAGVGALVTAAALGLEPLARSHTPDAIRSHAVWLGEVGAGIALALYAVSVRRRARPA
jgi:Family of unknown function (DUF6518)